MKIINQYSFVWVAVLIMVVGGVLIFWKHASWRTILVFCLLLLGLLAAWFFLRPRQTSMVDGARQIQETIGGGKPVLLEFQSPY